MFTFHFSSSPPHFVQKQVLTFCRLQLSCWVSFPSSCNAVWTSLGTQKWFKLVCDNRHPASSMLVQFGRWAWVLYTDLGISYYRSLLSEVSPTLCLQEILWPLPVHFVLSSTSYNWVYLSSSVMRGKKERKITWIVPHFLGHRASFLKDLISQC